MCCADQDGAKAPVGGSLMQTSNPSKALPALGPMVRSAPASTKASAQCPLAVFTFVQPL